MENVIQRLKEYVEEVDLTARFDYSFEISQAIFSDSERNLLLSDSNPFQQNIRQYIHLVKYLGLLTV
jgi:hypothetical protein